MSSVMTLTQAGRGVYPRARVEPASVTSTPTRAGINPAARKPDLQWLRRPGRPWPLVFLASLFTCLAAAAAEDVDALIRRAGNAEDDRQRLEILQRLGRAPGLDPSLKADAERLAAAVVR